MNNSNNKGTAARGAKKGSAIKKVATGVVAANKSKKATPLMSYSIFVRVRPAVWDESGHDQDGVAVAKSLDGWNEFSVTLNTAYLFSDGQLKYTFPKKVLGAEVNACEERFNL